MGSIRFLSCGESVENYNICLDEKVAGFVRNTAKTGDLVYFSFKVMQSDKKFKS